MIISFCVGVIGLEGGGALVLLPSDTANIIGNIYGFVCIILAILQLYFGLRDISFGIGTDIPMDAESGTDTDTELYCCCEKCECQPCYCTISYMSIYALIVAFVCLAGGYLCN